MIPFGAAGFCGFRSDIGGQGLVERGGLGSLASVLQLLVGERQRSKKETAILATWWLFQ